MAGRENYDISTYGLTDRRSSSELPTHIGPECPIRTDDPLVPNQMYYQAVLIPDMSVYTDDAVYDTGCRLVCSANALEVIENPH